MFWFTGGNWLLFAAIFITTSWKKQQMPPDDSRAAFASNKYRFTTDDLLRELRADCVRRSPLRRAKAEREGLISLIPFGGGLNQLVPVRYRSLVIFILWLMHKPCLATP
jgi:hypothetical protein